MATLIESETALGKSFAVLAVAALLGVKVQSMNVHEGTGPEDFLGALEPDETGENLLVFKDGHMVKAMEQGEWLVLEELNMGSSGALETLNFYLSHNRIYVKRNGVAVKVKIHSRFRLFGSMNPKSYGARKALSRPFLSRWMFWRKKSDASELREHLTELGLSWKD